MVLAAIFSALLTCVWLHGSFSCGGAVSACAAIVHKYVTHDVFGAVLPCLCGFCLHPYSTQFGWRASRVQVHVRSALVSAVSRRTLSMRASQLRAYSSGAVTNMMSVDAQKVSEF